ncbi:MAG: hypothetical protein QM698_15060 [Micropepsaceae bacterium]
MRQLVNDGLDAVVIGRHVVEGAEIDRVAAEPFLLHALLEDAAIDAHVIEAAERGEAENAAIGERFRLEILGEGIAAEDAAAREDLAHVVQRAAEQLEMGVAVGRSGDAEMALGQLLGPAPGGAGAGADHQRHGVAGADAVARVAQMKARAVHARELFGLQGGELGDGAMLHVDRAVDLVGAEMAALEKLDRAKRGRTDDAVVLDVGIAAEIGRDGLQRLLNRLHVGGVVGSAPPDRGADVDILVQDRERRSRRGFLEPRVALAVIAAAKQLDHGTSPRMSVAGSYPSMRDSQCGN